MTSFDFIGADTILGAGSVDKDIAAGGKDVNVLTDQEFHRRHPERNGAPIRANERALTKEWIEIRDGVVRPALVRAAASPAQQQEPASSPVALVSAGPPREEGWTVGRVIKYGLGGLLGALLLGWIFRHRGGIAIEARAAARHAGQLAGRARASLGSLGAEHRTLRHRVATERQAAQRTQRMRTLETSLAAADREVQKAQAVAEQRARQLQALRSLHGAAS